MGKPQDLARPTKEDGLIGVQAGKTHAVDGHLLSGPVKSRAQLKGRIERGARRSIGLADVVLFLDLDLKRTSQELIPARLSCSLRSI